MEDQNKNNSVQIPQISSAKAKKNYWPAIKNTAIIAALATVFSIHGCYTAKYKIEAEAQKARADSFSAINKTLNDRLVEQTDKDNSRYNIIIDVNKKLTNDLKSRYTLDELLDIWKNSYFKVSYKTKDNGKDTVVLATAGVNLKRPVEEEDKLLYCNSRNKIGNYLMKIMPEKWAKYNDAYKRNEMDIYVKENSMQIKVNDIMAKKSKTVNTIKLSDKERSKLIEYLRN